MNPTNNLAAHFFAPFLDLTGKVAVVTGGGTGLGREISIALAKCGAKVVIAGRNLEHLNPVAAEIVALGGDPLVVQTNVREIAEIENLVRQTLQRFGRLDILVNNAAANFAVAAEKLSPGGLSAVLDTVVDGTFHCSQFCAREMVKQGGGVILNIGANYAGGGFPGVGHSAAAKSAVLSITKTLAVEWGPHGIRVNVFAPGTMDTDGASANLGLGNPEIRKAVCRRTPLGRLTNAEEMAEDCRAYLHAVV